MPLIPIAYESLPGLPAAPPICCHCDLDLASNPQDLDWYERVEIGVGGLGHDAGLDAAAATLLPLAVIEAVNNIVEHAYGNAHGKPIGIRGRRERGRLVVELRDRGRPMPMPLPTGVTSATAECGRGWQIIRSVFPWVQYRRQRDENILTLIRPLAVA